MMPIGGYFGLELMAGVEYHDKTIRLNTGRNALEYILLANKYEKIYLPFYTCEVLLQPIKRLNLNFDFYSINEYFEPIFDYSKVKKNECFLYTNYFGLKDTFVEKIASMCDNLIIDNAQAFFSKPLGKVDTFYSARKFFGVPDGAYLYSVKKNPGKLRHDISVERCSHLLKRLDLNAENGYFDFKSNEKKLDNQPILEMSVLSQKILSSIGYNKVARIRRKNYDILNNALQDKNKLRFDIDQLAVPMVYPFLSLDKNLREKLIDKKIFVAQYWLNNQITYKKDSLEHKYSEEIVHLPIDQRYSEKEMQTITTTIL